MSCPGIQDSHIMQSAFPEEIRNGLRTLFDRRWVEPGKAYARDADKVFEVVDVIGCMVLKVFQCSCKIIGVHAGLLHDVDV
jgi:hypothetical protein